MQMSESLFQRVGIRQRGKGFCGGGGFFTPAGCHFDSPQSDVVVYDRLVSSAIIDRALPGTELVYVGKATRLRL